MVKSTWIIAAVASLGLSACAGLGDSDLERAAIGGGIGVLTSDATGIDPVAAGAAGVAAGLLCDDAGICRRARN